jgi:hypothetical protein
LPRLDRQKITFVEASWTQRDESHSARVTVLGRRDDSIVIGFAHVQSRSKTACWRLLPGLTFLMCSARSNKELGWVDLQHLGKLPNDFQADIGHGSLDPADVGTIDPSFICQVLLGNPPVVPDAAQIGRESLAEVHASATGLWPIDPRL